jgi:hypothetical protein
MNKKRVEIQINNLITNYQNLENKGQNTFNWSLQYIIENVFASATTL